MSRNYFWLIPVFSIVGCVTAPPKPPPFSIPTLPVPVTRFSALIRLDPQDVPSFEDDLDTASLHTAALQSLSYYQSLPDSQLFVLGNDTYTARDLAASMSSLVVLLESSKSPGDWLTALRGDFAWYQSAGIDAQRTVTFSSYYEPSISARLAKDRLYRFPLYARPPDLIDVDLGLFKPTYQGVRISGQRKGNNLVPYPTRADIDSAHVLKNQGLEIAWAKDPLDVLDLQIEGSGWLDLGGGDIRRVRYDGNNGRPYKSVGQNLIATGRIPAREFNRTLFLSYLARHPEERQSLLNVDERYIFFRIDTSTAAAYAYGNIDVPLTPARSIATDPQLFPKGALAWIDTTRAVVDTQGDVHGRTALKRFMLNQDEGGAILGPGRVDFFAGHGPDAAHFATHMWNKGALYFLVKKRQP